MVEIYEILHEPQAVKGIPGTCLTTKYVRYVDKFYQMQHINLQLEMLSGRVTVRRDDLKFKVFPSTFMCLPNHFACIKLEIKKETLTSIPSQDSPPLPPHTGR